MLLRFLSLLLFVFCGCLTATCAVAATVVVPGANANVEGNANSTAPFNGPFRYQQVYLGSEFGGTPFLIDQIPFRADASQSADFTATVADMTVLLSLTSADTSGPGTGLSSTFDDNILGAQMTVYDGGIVFNSTPMGTPHDFDVVIALSAPYLYDPAGGNLLLEILNQSAWSVSAGGGFGFLDFEFSNSSLRPIARVFAFDPLAAAALANDPNRGLVTAFTGSAVPLPGAVWMLSAAVAGFAPFATRNRV